ncbi:FMR1-interacting protein NUFIP2-like [Hoplias malabaricus]|uniref:FMR1-interacting protein NUFIP2-like n=1 Tax=Hoplias malabaricus TaxID=27720 RepID=UPI003461BDC7
MDGNNKTSGLPHCEVRPLDEKGPLLSLNGDVSFGSGYITNGYSTKAAADDGSGSESGYTTPKKRRAKRISVKGSENVSRDKEKAVQWGTTSYFKQDLETLGQETAGKVVNSRPNCTKTCLKTEVHTDVRQTGVQEMTPVGEVQCKNPDSRASGPVSKKTDDKVNKTKLTSSVTSKEDSWTLFKPPPVFPVDNSSAKIVPKISYASKVKENLNKSLQASAEAALAQVSVKISQVPMSAVKTSVNFANGPVSGEANGCPPVGILFNSAASAAPSASCNLGEENVASALDTSCSSSACPSAPEPRKSSLFVYPHKPLNMQTVLPSARHVDAPDAQTNQKALGDIFQNQWGLSFINEPNGGPEGTVSSRPTVSALKVADITFQGESLPFFNKPGLDPTSAVSLPAPQEVEKRTSSPDAALKACSPTCTASEDSLHAQSESQDQEKGEIRSSEASCKDLDAGASVAPVVNALSPSKAQNYVKEHHDVANSWGLFDLRDAVLYHTKEFEYLVTLRKQDPKRVVYYEENLDGPDH